MLTSSFIVGSQTKTVQLPTSWMELYPFMSAPLYKALLSLDNEMIRIIIAEHFVKHHAPRADRSSRIEAISQIAQVFSYIDFQSFHGFEWQYDLQIGLIKYPMSKAMMHNSTLRELVIADSFLDKYVQGDTEAIWPLMGAIYRPSTCDLTYKVQFSDGRIPLLSQDHAINIGKIYKRHATTYFYQNRIIKAAAIALLTVLATKHFFAKNYIPHLNSDDDKPEKKGINFGWHELAFDISEAGNFGTIDQVYNRNIHQIMLYCIKKKQDQEASKSKSNNP